MRDEVAEQEQYHQGGLYEVDGLNRDLVECHGQVLWKRPQAYLVLTQEMERAMGMFKDLFEERLAERRIAMAVMREDEGEEMDVRVNGSVSAEDAARKHDKELDRLHRSMLARMNFYRIKLKGLENYIHTTLQRLKVQREAVSVWPWPGEMQ